MFVLVVPLVPSPFTMTISAVPGDVVAGIVAFLHVYFMCLETFMWRGRARKVFGTPRAIADITANLAANQVSARCPVRHPFAVFGAMVGAAHVQVLLLPMWARVGGRFDSQTGAVCQPSGVLQFHPGHGTCVRGSTCGACSVDVVCSIDLGWAVCLCGLGLVWFGLVWFVCVSVVSATALPKTPRW